MSDSNETEGEGSWRRRAQGAYSKGRDWASEKHQQAVERSPTYGRASKKSAEIGGKGTDAVRSGLRKVDEGVGARTNDLTLAEYRQLVDEALAEAVAVVLAQDAEIRALERRVAVLSEGRGDAGAG